MSIETEEAGLGVAEPFFESDAEALIYRMFVKGFGTCRANSGEYTVQFRFQHLEDAQKVYSDLCNLYLSMFLREYEALENASKL